MRDEEDWLARRDGGQEDVGGIQVRGHGDKPTGKAETPFEIRRAVARPA